MMTDDKYLDPKTNPFIVADREEPAEEEVPQSDPRVPFPVPDDDREAGELEAEALKTLKAIGGRLCFTFGRFLALGDDGALIVTDGANAVDLKTADEETREMVRKALNAG